MFEDYARGKSQATIARELNAAGIRTARGAASSQSVVGQTMRNPLYRGMVRYGAELFDGRHQSIVSEELWREVEKHTSLAFGTTMQDAGVMPSRAAAATPSTTPSPRASLPRSRPPCSTGTRSAPATRRDSLFTGSRALQHPSPALHARAAQPREVRGDHDETGATDSRRRLTPGVNGNGVTPTPERSDHVARAVRACPGRRSSRFPVLPVVCVVPAVDAALGDAFPPCNSAKFLTCCQTCWA
jgi:hypothetical protein